jgi:hypothetical protein
VRQDLTQITNLPTVRLITYNIPQSSNLLISIHQIKELRSGRMKGRNIHQGFAKKTFNHLLSRPEFESLNFHTPEKRVEVWAHEREKHTSRV